MPRIADYLIISDNQISSSRQQGGGFSQEYNFTVEDSAHLGSRSVLNLTYIILPGTNDFRFQIKINGSVQADYVFNYGSPTVASCLQEVINANVLQHGNNTIHFHPISGVGEMLYSDIVLHYQRDI